MPAALVVTVAFFATNFLAHSSLRPPYMHRGEAGWDDDWYHFSYLRRSDGENVESYWNHPGKIDEGESSVAWYAFNVLVGHHGIFSLTPIWLLVIPGVWWMLEGSTKVAGAAGDAEAPGVAECPSQCHTDIGESDAMRRLAVLIGAVSVVVIVFYLYFVRHEDRNYGGVTCGFRWVIWLTPLWLWAALPAADWMAMTNARRRTGYVLLAISVFSASYAVWSPSISPWLSEVFTFLGIEST